MSSYPKTLKYYKIPLKPLIQKPGGTCLISGVFVKEAACAIQTDGFLATLALKNKASGSRQFMGNNLRKELLPLKIANDLGSWGK